MTTIKTVNETFTVFIFLAFVYSTEIPLIPSTSYINPLFFRTKLDEGPIFSEQKRRFIEFGSENERRISGFTRAILPVRIGVIVGVILFFKKFSTPSITPLLFWAC